jgi:EpsI family protein
MQMKRTQTLHFWFLFALIVAGGAGVKAWERAGEAKTARRELKDFPSRVGNWRQTGADMRFDAETEKVLRADDYLSRNYALAAQSEPAEDSYDISRAAERESFASFYVGYYASQRSGATYHSPLNCLPGAGWTLSEHRLIKITPVVNGGQSAPAFEASRYVIQNGDEKQLLIYWYQGRGRALASEYWGKIYTIVDGIERRRSDGAMVRVLVPLPRDGGAKEEQAAERLAVDFAARAAPLLSDFVPN